MMSEIVMMEAALFQLRAAIADDPQFVAVRISADLLGSALTAAKAASVNAARVNDIEFALNDLIAAIDDGGAPDAVYAAVAMLQNDAAVLRNASALPKELVVSMRDLQMRLKTRAKALERTQYREAATPAEELPHAPHELREVAIPIARQLAGAGFETPALDALIADPESLRYHVINEIIDEIDVIAGS